MRCLQPVHRRGSLHLAICGVNTLRMDRTSGVLAAAALEAVQCVADSLCTKRLAAFQQSAGVNTLRTDRTSACSLLQPLEAIQCVADSLCTQEARCI